MAKEEFRHARLDWLVGEEVDAFQSRGEADGYSAGLEY